MPNDENSTLSRELALEAVRQFDEGEPRLLRKLSDRLTSAAFEEAAAVMAVSQNALSEREAFVVKAKLHGLITRAEVVELTFALSPAREAATP